MNIENINLIENDVNSFKKPMDEHMKKAIDHFDGELIKIRTGRAHTTLVEDIQVSVYGQAPTRLKNLAALAAPESRLITIQPWDVNIVPDIEKAIKLSDLGITPVSEGKVIRIQLPEMSSSRRDELIKTLGKKLEECRVAIRNIRKDFNNLIRDSKKDKKISENFFNRLNDVLQEVTDHYVKIAEDKAKKKEVDLKTI